LKPTEKRAASVRLLDVRIRRTSQAIFLAAFFLLLVHAKPNASSGSGPGSTSQISWFFLVDPLITSMNAIAARTVVYGSLWMLLILIPTVVLGRLFCGWICPLGTLNHLAAYVGSRFSRKKRSSPTSNYRSWQAIKYLLIISGTAAAAFGMNLAGWIDPISLLVRSTGLSLLPTVSSRKYTVIYQPHYGMSIALAVMFALLLAANLRTTRFWCRALCPLGALLGLTSRWSRLTLVKNEKTCNRCRHCQAHCQGGDNPMPGEEWKRSECHLCANCVASCPSGSLKFGLEGASPEQREPDLKRRAVCGAAVAGLVGTTLLRAEAVRATHKRAPVRPPGALEEWAFLSRCIRCGECMRVCPNHALQPAFIEGGLAGIWTPELAAQIGYCEPSCVLCSQVGPTGAIGL